MPGHPGYFVTADGAKQMIMTPRGSFAICETARGSRGYKILRGPVRDPAKLGIPQYLLDEAEEMTVDALIQRLKAGQKVTVDVTPLVRGG
jgi:hypothetical protein